MPIETWDEIRTAYHVARLGTVSGAAEVLGVHHATVIRHIDALETRLGVKLFQRHPRGYTPTEAGEDLLQVAQVTAEQFDQLSGRLHGHGAKVTGELVLTTLDVLAPLLTPVVASFQSENDDLAVKFLTGTRLFRLEYGEAHVAIRAGAEPQDPDNIVQPLYSQQVSLYATEGYAARHGLIGDTADLRNHRFIGAADDAPRAPFHKWLKENVPADRIVFRASADMVNFNAVESGVGAGFLPVWYGDRCAGLVRLCPPRVDWTSPIWLITHVDLHRTAKVQSFTAHLKQAAKDWPGAQAS